MGQRGGCFMQGSMEDLPGVSPPWGTCALERVSLGHTWEEASPEDRKFPKPEAEAHFKSSKQAQGFVTVAERAREKGRLASV